MDLFYRETGEGNPLIILHGLFGSSDNWMTLAKKYGETFRVIVPDLRNHGQSPHDALFSYEEMSEDLVRLIDKLKLGQVNIIGHSMGGKVAMKFAAIYPDKVSKLIVADISPKYYPVHHDHIISALRSLDLPNISSRNEADSKLSLLIQGAGERQFLLKNLKRSTVGFEWKMALDFISNRIEEVGRGLSNSDKIELKTLLIRGGNSSYILDDELGLIEDKFKNFDLETIDGVGHWVHSEKPLEFYDISMKYLTS